jgi:AcrR family transcriptional regulator
MTTRADSAFRTSERILDAALDLYRAQPYPDVAITAIAARAGVTGQTVIRHFGGKAGAVVAAIRRELERLTAARADAPPGIGPALSDLADFYESNATLLLRVYADAPTVDGLPEVARAGREFHLRWCRELFAPVVADLPPAPRAQRLAQLVAACDAVTWRVVREDCGLDAEDARAAFVDLVSTLAAH